jgi:hypothetical protein
MAPPRKKQAKYTPEERARVLEAYGNGEDWLAAAKANGISRSRAYALKNSRRTVAKKRGGVRAVLVKVTPEIMITLQECLENNVKITLEEMRVRVLEEYDIDISFLHDQLELNWDDVHCETSANGKGHDEPSPEQGRASRFRPPAADFP